ncbi:hypothetical protein [Rhodoferax sp.]|uniref:hypothetical protein n=1 Tax=Rhodoferax sp. TaxID=50421 RepID=UPI00271F04B6|nr:hypothetical protein [Rhodoferax sp.]MDO9195342.1 hypothetical protein [Rhodoferax sp.]
MHWPLLIVAVMLVSCSSMPPYPANLPALVPTDTTMDVCPSIAGRFADTGRATAPDGQMLGSVSLTRLLHPAHPDSKKVDVVVVRGPTYDLIEIESLSDEKRVDIWRQPKVTKEAYLAKGDQVVAETYLCQNGFARLGRQYDVGGGGTPGLLLLGVKSDFLWLRKSVDGSLIALHTDYDYVLMNMILPVGNVDRIWYRFPPVPTPIGTAPDPRVHGHLSQRASAAGFGR